MRLVVTAALRWVFVPRREFPFNNHAVKTGIIEAVIVGWKSPNIHEQGVGNRHHAH